LLFLFVRMITIILVCYKRFIYLDDILNAWLEQVDEVIVIDNSGTFKTDLPILVININKNLGPQVKYPFSFLAKNKWVIYADDDIMPLPGLARDLFKHKKKGIIGVIGRVFDGNGYYTSTGYRGGDIKRPVKVDWLGGGCTLAPRRLGAVNIRDCPAMELDDWWWEDHFKHNLYVIPTNNYKFLFIDEDSLHKSDKCKKLREEYYETNKLGVR